MDEKQLIKDLEIMSELLQLDGANPFKSGAYSKAARILSDLNEELATVIEEDRLTKIKGVGKGIAEKIHEFHETGQIRELKDLRDRIPKGLVEISSIPGLGAKKTRVLYKELDIDTVEKLQKACEDGRVEKLKGFGQKSAEKILAGIAQQEKFSGRNRLDKAQKLALPILEKLRKNKDVKEADIGGSLRRWKETVKDIDFVVSTQKPKEVMDFFASLEGVTGIVAKGETKSSVVLDESIQADLRCVTPEQYPFALLHFTGSKEHNTRLRQLAKEKNLKLNEYGLFPEENEENSLPSKSEKDVYKHLGLSYIIPEQREDMGEVEAAQNRGELPETLKYSDLKGILHMHTHYSDGKPKLEEYAEWADGNGIEWMGIADHSQSLKVANGLSPERVKKQHEEIDEVNKKFKGKKIRLLKGIESDILPDGKLDYTEDLLESFDFIVASVHTNFGLSKPEQTKRIIKALEHPATTILGHMTGRLLLQRDGYALDEKEVIKAAAKNNVAIEINANPRRLDIDWRLIQYAKEQGCLFSIGPDAHVMDGLEDIHFGIAMARKGWLTPEDVVNCLTATQFLKFANK